MLDLQQLFARLEELGIAHRTSRAPAGSLPSRKPRRLRGDLPGHHIKNLFLRNRKEEMWLVVALEDRTIDPEASGRTAGRGQVFVRQP